jgi:hypothetical protein
MNRNLDREVVEIAGHRVRVGQLENRQLKELLLRRLTRDQMGRDAVSTPKMYGDHSDWNEYAESGYGENYQDSHTDYSEWSENYDDWHER